MWSTRRQPSQPARALQPPRLHPQHLKHRLPAAPPAPPQRPNRTPLHSQPLSTPPLPPHPLLRLRLYHSMPHQQLTCTPTHMPSSSSSTPRANGPSLTSNRNYHSSHPTLTSSSASTSVTCPTVNAVPSHPPQSNNTCVASQTVSVTSNAVCVTPMD